MVYDVTNNASFDNLEDWLAVVKKILSTSKTAATSTTSTTKPHFALIANKSWLSFSLYIYTVDWFLLMVNLFAQNIL